VDITEFVIDNCTRQNAVTPADYIGMALACKRGLSVFYKNHLRQMPVEITARDILTLGELVNNTRFSGWRAVPAHFANGNTGVAPEHINRLINQLIEHQAILTPEEFYHQFERIHPFVDGNGRVGAILYNMLKGAFWINPPEMTW